MKANIYNKKCSECGRRFTVTHRRTLYCKDCKKKIPAKNGNHFMHEIEKDLEALYDSTN